MNEARTDVEADRRIGLLLQTVPGPADDEDDEDDDVGSRDDGNIEPDDDEGYADEDDEDEEEPWQVRAPAASFVPWFAALQQAVLKLLTCGDLRSTDGCPPHAAPPGSRIIGF